MPIPSQYRRKPLLGLTLTPVNDNAVKWECPSVNRLLSLINVGEATPLQCVYATILGGYDTAPEQPELDGRNPEEEPVPYAEDLAAAEMIAIMSRSMEEVNYVREKLALWLKAMERMSEADIFATGEIMLRTIADFYARTGDKTCLAMAEKYRAYLPDVSSFLSTFPFQSAYVPDRSGRDREYHERMERFAKHPCATVSMCAALCRFSGSKTAWDAVGKGFDALYRYHSLPGGMIAQTPYLAGHDPTEGTDAEAVCEQITALCDALLLTGDLKYAEKLEMLIHNVLPELISEKGVKSRLVPSRMSDGENVPPKGSLLTALLEALVSLRRCVITRSEDDTVEIMLHQKAEALIRMESGMVRILTDGRGFCRRVHSTTVECGGSTKLRLRIRVPALPDGARLQLNGANPQLCPVGQLALIDRTFQNGDTVDLQTTYSPRCEAGYRNGLSVYCGETLMALPVPGEGSEFRYALCAGEALTVDNFEGQHCVVARAVSAPEWSIGQGKILPPPQNIRRSGSELELILLTAAGLQGRIGLLPVARV